MDKKQDKFDVVVIGGGPGGYPAAITAAQSGKSVALIEAKELGGTCLNRGCIPSKALIASADVLHRVREAEELGVLVNGISFNFSKMAQRKDQVVAKMRKGVEGLMAANRITLFRGVGKFIAPKEIKIIGEDNVVIRGDKVIIATGSEPRNIAAFPFDHERIHDSTSLLELQTLPKSLVIIGGGVIGSEFASLYSILGVDVTILEMLPRIIPMEDQRVSQALAAAFQKRGMKLHTGVTVTGIERTETGITVRLVSGETFSAEMALVAVGRSLNTSAIGLEKAGVLVNSNGMIPVDDKMETNVPGIYAVGDIASKWWLAHVATHQGVVAGKNATGGSAHMHYTAVPNVIFTTPEIGTVGLTLEDALAKGFPAVIGAFPFQALGKSQAALQAEGFAQVVLDRRTGQVLGAQVVGHEAATLIAEMALVIANELTVECIAETIHAHPTIAEVWPEAVLMGMETPLHLPPKKKK